jgi:hypothetical protein
MSALQTTSKLSAEDLREEVRKKYADVALDPHEGFHFHTGRAAADCLGYDPSFILRMRHRVGKDCVEPQMHPAESQGASAVKVKF